MIHYPPESLHRDLSYKKFGLADSKGVHTPMTDCRRSVKDQPGHINGAVQSLYREMVGSLLLSLHGLAQI